MDDFFGDDSGGTAGHGGTSTSTNGREPSGINIGRMVGHNSSGSNDDAGTGGIGSLGRESANSESESRNDISEHELRERENDDDDEPEQQPRRRPRLGRDDGNVLLYA
jgi:hypothetical protein